MFNTRSAIPLGFCLTVAACQNDSRDPTAPEVELGTVESAASIVNFWSTKSSLPGARVFPVAGAQNEIIYFVGGRDGGGQTVKTVYAYSLATNTWSFKADLPNPRRAANGASFLNGRLYVSGGISHNGDPAKSLYQYNPNTNTWATKKTLPNASACGAQGVIAGRLYVYSPAGGSCGAHHRFYRYNPDNNSWTTLPTPPSMHLSPVGGVINSKFYLVGGSSDAFLTPNLALHVYDPGTNSWSTKASLPSKQQNAAGAVVSGKLYVVGGINFTAPGAPPIATVRAYNPASNSWETKASMITPRHYHAGVHSGNKLWAISGFGAGGYSTKVEAYTP